MPSDPNGAPMPTDAVLSSDAVAIIERQIKEVEALKADWERRLAEFRTLGRYRLRINAQWETDEQVNARMQGMIDNFASALQNLSAFRAVWKASDN